MIAQKAGSDAGTDGYVDLKRDDDLSVGYQLTTEDSKRLKNIEQALQEQRQLLETIASQNHQVFQLTPLFLPFSSYFFK
ncbi:unnamed protein product [Onchocerca flexuosa]|uniref:Lipoprotein n=1 Tax=Onchocerca flexuosa TaxID=387005 RepID=A0A183HW86_9BILA|nr:unnamed protein product [Onchocerca flexuosa]